MTTRNQTGDDLLSWLNATLGEVEADIRRLIACRDAEDSDDPADPGYLSGGWSMWGEFGDIADRHTHLDAWLAAVQADQAILAVHQDDGPFVGGPRGFECLVCVDPEEIYDRVHVPYPCPTVRLVASRYAHRPGWRPEWAPEEMVDRC